MAKSARSEKADELIDAGSEAGGAIARGFAAAVAAALERHRTPQTITLSQGLEEIVRRFSLELEAAVYDSTIAGYVVGATGIVAPLARPNPSGPPVNPPRDIRFAFYPPDGPGPRIEFPILDAAINTLQQAETLTPQTYYSMAAAARQNAFTVSGNIQTATVERLREILAENVFHKSSRTEFIERVRAELPDLPLAEHRVEQVFRNNVNAAYSDGGEAALADPAIVDAFPYRAYYCIRDDRCRKEHRAMETLGLNGTNVFHYLDPVWRMFRPPWDWNCRCGWNPLTIRRAAAKGVVFAKQWLETGLEPAKQFVPWPSFLPSESWRRINPPGELAL